MFHLTISQALLKSHPKLFKACTRRLDVVDRDGDMSKAPARVRVAARIALEVGIGLGPMVVCELKDA